MHTQDVKKVVWHPTDPLLFSASYDDTVKVYKEFGDDWECADSLAGLEFELYSLTVMHGPGMRYYALCTLHIYHMCICCFELLA